MNAISDILFRISTGLMVPVIVLLIILFVRSILLAGGFFGRYLSVHKTEKLLRESLEGLTAGNVDELKGRLPAQSNAPVIGYIRRMLDVQSSPAHTRRLLADFEITADKDMAVCKTLARLGPILGLMGTLIPMGPALVGLSAGDIASMASNMQIAFATTVVGLFAGGIGFVTQQVKQRWYLHELTDLEFLAELFNEKHQAK
jgi:biopolymer transport protein ExbB/TolQ